ncbi:MAG: DUF1963 domain-containing protein [Deltaproteobacteria bacterium]|nr:DUF1963 domain-containing protein [Deltaproteobacteria bacterium]
MPNQIDPSRIPEACAAVGLDPDATAARLAPAVRLRVTVGDARVGASKLGGLPDLPAYVPWPRWAMSDYNRNEIADLRAKPQTEHVTARIEAMLKQQEREVPLAFLAQLDLSELEGLPHGLPLPSSGLLLFFDDLAEQPWGYCDSHRRSFRVLHVPAGSTLERRPPPADLPAEHVLKEGAVRFEAVQTLPVWPEDMDDWDAYLDLGDALEPEEEIAAHQIGGHPDQVQGDMARSCALVTQGVYLGRPPDVDEEELERLASSHGEWRLLLQLASDDDLDWMWGDLGNLYFWMREADIAAGAWDQAWFQLQCG